MGRENRPVDAGLPMGLKSLPNTINGFKLSGAHRGDGFSF